MGGVVTCNAFVPLSPVLEVEPGPANALDDGLVLTESTDDGSRVTGVFVRQTSKPTNILHHVSLLPWASWPTSKNLGPVHDTTLESGEFDVGRSPGSHVALAVRLTQNSFVPNLDPNLEGPPTEPFVALPDIYPADVTPQAAGLSGTSHLVSTGDGSSVAASVLTNGVWVSSTGKLGCSAPQGPRIGAVAFQDGWLVAASTGVPPLTCDNLGAPQPGLPQQIDVYRITAKGGISLVTVLGPAQQIIELQTAPHPSGMYVVWSDANPPAVGIFAARVDGVSGVAVGATPVQAPGETTLGFKATALGNRLMVARRNGDFASSQAVLLSLFDESLTSITNGSLESPDPVVGPTSALGSRDGRSVLIAFTTQANQKFRAHIARFDCAP